MGFGRVDGFHYQLAVGTASGCRVGAKGGVGRVGLNQNVGLGERVAGVTGPCIVQRVGNHACADRIEFDVAVAAQKIVFTVDQAGFVASFPKCAGAPVAIVDVADIAAPEGLHDPDNHAGLRWGDQQVHMVGHQHVGMNLAATLEHDLVHFPQVAEIVAGLKETGLAVVAALYDVLGDSGKVEPWSAWHGQTPMCGVLTMASGVGVVCKRTAPEDAGKVHSDPCSAVPLLFPFDLAPRTSCSIGTDDEITDSHKVSSYRAGC